MPVVSFDRHANHIMAQKPVINSDVKLQEDLLTTTTLTGETTTCKQNTIPKKPNNINAHIDSYSNNKYTKW